MKATFLLLALILGIVPNATDKKATSITWIEDLGGDFSFAKRKSIVCDAWCYEWAGTSEVIVERIGKDTVHCYTLMNEATHCSLDLILVGDSCVPAIVLKSVAPEGDKIFEYKKGWIKIDRTSWEKNILKAEFDFDFINEENEKRIFWKGKIYKRFK